eukprot:358098-Chlamydomonas_euryale.AAC.4
MHPRRPSLLTPMRPRRPSLLTHASTPHMHIPADFRTSTLPALQFSTCRANAAAPQRRVRVGEPGRPAAGLGLPAGPGHDFGRGAGAGRGAWRGGGVDCVPQPGERRLPRRRRCGEGAGGVAVVAERGPWAGSGTLEGAAKRAGGVAVVAERRPWARSETLEGAAKGQGCT